MKIQKIQSQQNVPRKYIRKEECSTSCRSHAFHHAKYPARYHTIHYAIHHAMYHTVNPAMYQARYNSENHAMYHIVNHARYNIVNHASMKKVDFKNKYLAFVHVTNNK